MNVYKTIDKIPNFELIFLLSIILFEPRHEKTCLWGFRRGKTIRPVKLQRLARGWKFWIQKLEILCYLGSEQQRRWSVSVDAQADVHHIVRIWNNQVFSWWGSFFIPSCWIYYHNGNSFGIFNQERLAIIWRYCVGMIFFLWKLSQSLIWYWYT